MTKKYLIVIIVLIIIYLLIPGGNNKKQNNKKRTNENTKIEETKGVFISYLELNTYIKDKDEKTSKSNIDEIISNIKNSSFDTIYLQVRSHADSIYESDLFPTSKSIILKDNTSYDVLDYFINNCHKKNINVYGWINPYRIGESVDNNSTYYKRVGRDNIKMVNDIYYFNPASKEIESLIVDGVGEVVKNYEVDGIIFDDYFYPSKDIDINEYQHSNTTLSLEEYHLDIINSMVKKVNAKIKKINKNVLFGISPEGNIDNNYNSNFADVKTWAKKEGYVDFLMPQVYYGFENSTKPYTNVINEWNNITTNKNVNLYFALSFYKVGTIDEYAKDGKMEWIENSDIIKRQVEEARKLSNYKGFSIFRYDSLFNKEKYTVNTIKELEELKKIM